MNSPDGKRTSFQIGSNQQTAHPSARHSQGFVSYVRSMSISERDRYPIGVLVLPGCFRRRTHTICVSQTSVSPVKEPCKRGRPNMVASTNLAWPSPKRLFHRRIVCQRSVGDLFVASDSKARLQRQKSERSNKRRSKVLEKSALRHCSPTFEYTYCLNCSC